MKIRHLIAIIILGITFGSCGARFNNPEELTVPILQAVKNNDVNRLMCLQPPLDAINPVFSANKGTVGWTYYNKYTQSYRDMQLKGRVRTNLDIINTITEENKLDWDKVEYSAPQKDEVNDSLSSYTIVTTDLKFPGGSVYQLKYHAAIAKGRWYLLDDIYFTTKPQASN